MTLSWLRILKNPTISSHMYVVYQLFTHLGVDNNNCTVSQSIANKQNIDHHHYHSLTWCSHQITSSCSVSLSDEVKSSSLRNLSSSTATLTGMDGPWNHIGWSLPSVVAHPCPSNPWCTLGCGISAAFQMPTWKFTRLICWFSAFWQGGSWLRSTF